MWQWRCDVSGVGVIFDRDVESSDESGGDEFSCVIGDRGNGESVVRLTSSLIEG